MDCETTTKSTIPVSTISQDRVGVGDGERFRFIHAPVQAVEISKKEYLIGASHAAIFLASSRRIAPPISPRAARQYIDKLMQGRLAKITGNPSCLRSC